MRQMRDHARRSYPDECCGILLGDGGRIEKAQAARNVHPNPGTHFEIAPDTLIDAHRQARRRGPDIVGYYHSHPNGRPGPSPTDAASAAHDGRVWIILSRTDDGDWSIGAWRDIAAGFQSLRIVPSD